MAQEEPTVPSPENPAQEADGGAVLPVTQPVPAETPTPPSFLERPPHSKTKSTLAPTSEFTRILLLAFSSRYIPRGLAELVEWFSVGKKNAQNGVRTNSKVAPLAYALSMGVGSATLSLKYNALVKSDIRNIFCEAVSYENGGDPAKLTFNDVARSDNLIVKHTIRNYRKQSFKRLGSDALFFLVTPVFWLPGLPPKKDFITDLLVGVKAGMALTETWNRKTTIFEDLVTFINAKINPRNGLGQPITEGEIFDLYQHYSDDFHPNKMFQNLLPRNAEEAQLWAESEPVFRRITELMNHTYAYKHNVALGDHGKRDADFALPKFIYLLGHDLIKPRHPEETLLTINIANQYGIEAVKDMQAQLKAGASLEQVAARFPIAPDHWAPERPDQGANKVIAKGSTMQLSEAPVSKIDANSIRGYEAPSPVAAHAI